MKLAIENIIINTFQQTQTGKKILVCGYGKIGANVAKILKQESQVSVYDNDKIQLVKAKIDSYNLIDDLKDLSNFDLIIGVTGDFVLNEELLSLKDNVFLVNGSTRKKEFNFLSVKNHVLLEKKLHSVTRIFFDNNKCVNLLADGFPVNFCGTESTPEYILDVVFSEMFTLAQIIHEQKFNPGFYPVERAFLDVEKKVASFWLECWK